MLKEFVGYITYTLLKLEFTSQLGDALNFFIYDTLKIFLLLSVIIFIFPSFGYALIEKGMSMGTVLAFMMA